MQNSGPKQRFSFQFQNEVAILLLLSSFVYILFRVLTHKVSWVLPEVNDFRSYVLETGFSWKWSDWSRIFNFYAFEFGSRSSRILSSFVEILDSKFRASLWNFTVVPPALSLSLVFSLVLTPLFLFRVLKRWNVEKSQILTAVAFYLVSMGSLSLIAVQFRPAKAIANFGFVFLIELIQKKKPKTFLLCLLLLVFADESIAIAYLFPLIFARDLFSTPKLKWAFRTFPLIVFLILFYVLPSVSSWMGYGDNHLASYKPIRMVVLFKVKSFLIHTFDHLQVFLSEGIGLLQFWKDPSTPWKILGGIKVLLLSWVLLHAFKNRRENPLLKKVALAWIVLVVWHSVLMTLVSNEVWGPFWYGVYVSLFSAMLWALIAPMAPSRLIFTALTALVMVSSARSFEALNTHYFKHHYYPYNPILISEHFIHETNRFQNTTFDFNRAKVFANDIRETFRERSELNGCVVPKDQLYVVTELLGPRFRFSWLWLVRDADSLSYRITDDSVNPVTLEPQTIDIYTLGRLPCDKT